MGGVLLSEKLNRQADECGNVTVIHCPIILCGVAFQTIWPVCHQENVISYFGKTLSQRDILLLSVLPRSMVVGVGGPNPLEIKAIWTSYLKTNNSSHYIIADHRNSGFIIYILSHTLLFFRSEEQTFMA